MNLAKTMEVQGETTAQLEPAMAEYDLVVLGSGEAGKYIAWTLGKQGKRVAVIERKYIGGSCPNIACLPSKNVIHSAKVASYFGRASEFGIKVDGFSIDMTYVRARKRQMVHDLVEVHLANFKSSGVDIITGNGVFVAPRTIEVELPSGGVQTVRGEKIVISTGTQATVEDIPGLLRAQPMTHVELLELDYLPHRLIVFGGGFVGLELAQAMRRFGSEVVVIDRHDRLLYREDEDVSREMQQLMEAEGIQLRLGVTILDVSGQSGDSVKVRIVADGEEDSIEGTDLLVATGRSPNTRGIGLEAAGVKLLDSGYIAVNERLETTAQGIWAVGECAGSPHFTHIVFDDFRVLRDNLMAKNHVTTGRQVPHCLFTDPEFARVGLTEIEAQQRGISYRLVKIPMAAVLRTRTLSEKRGFLKALIAADSDRLLGFAAIGVDAGEIMGAVQIAIIAGLPYTALRDAVLTHPTLLEGLVVLFSSMPEMKAQTTPVEP